ncbi:MAG TPA: protein kinase [Candidatus Sulfotelmatobacter sp.]|nr:protein kinase [Candidatus Sulfotelmatobacter sp.]
MLLVLGTKLGPYEIVGLLGAGGMGEVYRARDTRLERMVAIKILPAHLSSDSVRTQRFEREAKTVSSLNHPHICVLHDVGHQDDIDYLVMECVEGETLAKRLEKGPLPVDQVLKLGAQIADALDKAHRAGIVHRDLKPGNIMVTATGAKLLDFGLAKPAAALASAATLTAASPTSPVTEQGTIVGTFQYMSPEQIEGKELDGRSDVFSLGAVLYEMLTGRLAFEGKSQLSVASAILEKEPAPVSSVKPMTPPALNHTVKKCLAKLPDERWQSASDLASELKWIAESGTQAAGAAVTPATTKSRERVAWLIAGALTVALVVTSIWLRNSKPLGQTMYFPAPMSFPASDIAIAPNGHTIAVLGHLESAGKNALWIYELGSQTAKNLAATEGATYPFWSPDGRYLAFFADGKLKKLEISGGPVQIVCDAPSGRGGTWNKDGVIVFTPDARSGEGLYHVSASGGTVTPLSTLDKNRRELSHRWPMFLPDGSHYLYMATNFAGQKGADAIFVGSLDSNEKHFVVEASANAAYAAPEYLLFYRDKTLFAQPFDLKRFALTGEARVVLTDLQYQPQVKRALFAVSENGLLVAQTGSGVALSHLVWLDRKGKELGAVGKPDVYGNVSIAPNGKSLAVSVTDIASQNTDIWTYDLQRGNTKRLTFDPAQESVPIWSPDTTRLVFASNRRDYNDLNVKNSDGAQEEENILHSDVDKFPNDWSPEGKYILYTQGTDLWFVTLPERKASLFLKAPSVLRNGQFSPDGKWVAYASNETGKWEIYVTSFPVPRGKWQVSVGGGEQPRWRGDGRELFYLSPDSRVVAVPVTTGANFDSGTPVPLFQAAPRQPIPIYDLFVYDVSRDGQRFLIITPVKEAERAPMSIVLNWTAKN